MVFFLPFYNNIILCSTNTKENHSGGNYWVMSPSFPNSNNSQFHICKKIYFPLTVGCDMKKEIDMVKNKIYNAIVINKQETVYDPNRFREFCISAGATKLFDTILGSITSFRHSADRTRLNKKRVVSFIYNLCYCLSQTCNPLQIDHALYLRSNQINQEGIETEHIMGHTPARRTVNNVVNTMSESHFKSFEDFITEATERKWLIVLIVDDFTSIHTKNGLRKINPLKQRPCVL